MQLDSIRRDRRRVALLAAPAFALALAACGGGSGEVSSSDAAEAPAATMQQAESNTTETTAANSSDSENSTTTGEAAADTVDASGTADALGSTSASIMLLDADEAIANAEQNQPTLQVVDNVLDIETLAVGDGSVQTLREVVDGDRPVLLWFYAPH